MKFGLIRGLALAAMGPFRCPARERYRRYSRWCRAVQDSSRCLGSCQLGRDAEGKGPFTVFAPTDEAFAKLPKETVASLLKPENRKQLTDILTYHVVPGKVEAKDVVQLNGAVTVNGQRVDILASKDGCPGRWANVVKTDIVCDKRCNPRHRFVILPASTTIPETAKAAGQFETLLAAAKAAGLAEVLGSAGPFTVFAPTDEAF